MAAIVLAVVSAWAFIATVVVGLCAAARAGDQVQTVAAARTTVA